MALNSLNSSRLRDLRPAEVPKPFTSQFARSSARNGQRNKAVQSPARESQIDRTEVEGGPTNQLVREGHYEAELVKRQVGSLTACKAALPLTKMFGTVPDLSCTCHDAIASMTWPCTGLAQHPAACLSSINIRLTITVPFPLSSHGCTST